MEIPDTHGVPASLYQKVVSKLVVHNGGTPHTEALAKRWGCGNTCFASFSLQVCSKIAQCKHLRQVAV